MPTGCVAMGPLQTSAQRHWDRTDPKAAVINRVSGARDVPLAGEAANTTKRPHGCRDDDCAEEICCALCRGGMPTHTLISKSAAFARAHPASRLGR